MVRYLSLCEDVYPVLDINVFAGDQLLKCCNPTIQSSMRYTPFPRCHDICAAVAHTPMTLPSLC
ncbi:hypothetical protein M404DRAFT_992895 [Pisolithus tinctorius Marx 270]|uniref:Uncharacterized protein n=1 Tax=Pisolithus tinctorius Marx 270 TaxID=870435 RepID=A0A0C3PVP2_PISTI|nr:hypothetical protein M404DRAFT_992895 [Pisolithus tinctorius Marx 270]